MKLILIALVLGLDAVPGGTTVTLSGGYHGGQKVQWSKASTDSGLEVHQLPDGCRYRILPVKGTKPPTQAVYIGGGEAHE